MSRMVVALKSILDEFDYMGKEDLPTVCEGEVFAKIGTITRAYIETQEDGTARLIAIAALALKGLERYGQLG